MTSLITLAKHVETELPRLLLVHLGGVVLHVHLVDLHAHALQDHHHGGLVNGSALFVKSIKTYLQRVDLKGVAAVSCYFEVIETIINSEAIRS